MQSDSYPREYVLEEGESMKELYGVDLAVQVLVNERPVWVKIRVPGWINFGILKHGTR